tara:strand:+ start:5819 stop:7303 length:1485 start_codon:yes stop_codon:yes gene_type:complete
MKNLLKNHQKNVRQQFKEQPGVIVFHSLGSGKTMTAIGCGEAYPERKKMVVVPASLVNNFKKELDKTKTNSSRYTVYSYEMFAKTPIHKSINAIIIVDEAHRLRNASSISASATIDRINVAFKVLFLTGTPIINHPADISPLVNIINIKRNSPTRSSIPVPITNNNNNINNLNLNFPMLPKNREKFEDVFFNVETKTNKINRKIFGITYSSHRGEPYKIISPKNTELFKKAVDGIVSFYENFNETNFPRKEERVLRITMSKLQQDMHIKAAKSSLTKQDLEIIKGKMNVNLNQNNGKAKRLNSFLAKTRQITNYVAKEKTSPKLEKVMELIEKGNGPVLVYSNYINSGVKQIDKMIKEKTNKSSFIFSGSITKKEKAKAVEKYNTGKLDVLLITASGSEGIDLKRTRQVIILEPHWNYSRIAQAIGRAVRYHSHINLNENKRHVDIYHLISIFSKNSWFNSEEKKLYKVSADTYLWDITQQKRKINEQFNELLK